MSLFLLGLITGLLVPALGNPRMGLASHVEAVMNGLVLMVLGLLWPKLVLSTRLLSLTFWLAVYGTFANWLATLLAGAWSAGNAMMPLAALGHSGTVAQEAIVKSLLVTLTLAIIAASILVLIGLFRTPAAEMESR